MEYNCKCNIIRTSWLYSEYGNNFVKTMLRLFGERNELKVVFDQVGTPTYAMDLAQIIVLMIEQDKFDTHKVIYNFSNEGVCSWYDFAVEIQKLTKSEVSIYPCLSNEFKQKAKRPKYSVMNKNKIKEYLNIEIPHWTTSLKKCLNNIGS